MGNQQGRQSRGSGRRIDWTTAERPSPPGKPYLVPEEGGKHTDIITIRWSPPTTDGGVPLIGYLVEHRRTGSPHWLRAIPDLVQGTELPLTGLEPGWRYQFRVSAENEVGRSDPGELSEPLTVTPQKWAACAPFFNVELQDTIGLENEKVEFRVQVIAVPPPTISWYKDGFELFSSRRTKIVTENDQSTFIIHQAALEDEGEIKCTATNRAGYAVTKAELKLEAPPRIRLPRQYEEGLIFEKGELIRLKVTAAGRPKPRVLWYHNGELLQRNPRVEITESETGSMVKIADASREDRGEYAIKGINKIGDDVASFLVTVTDCPSAPGKVQTKMYGRSVTLTWTKPEDDGGCKIGTYIVEYFRIGWDMWLKVKNSRQLSTILEDLIEGSEYKFRVRAENPYGISDPSEESETIFIPDLKRGILKPPPRSETNEVLKETKRHAETEETEEAKRRRLLEEKAKKLLDAPMSEIPATAEWDENAPPPVPKRKKGKGRSTPSPNLSERSLAKEIPIGGSLDKIRGTPSSLDQSSEAVNGTIQSADWVSKSEGLRRSGQFKFSEKDPTERESPMHPRENDDSILHGSSELMLVIYPRDRSKSVELSAQQRSEIEINLTREGVAPPMSLSAPELGGVDSFEPPLLRNAISSTELLYEKTAARLYQDSVEEEAQRMVKRRYSMDRKSVERRSSLKETLEKRWSLKEEVKLEDIIKQEEIQPATLRPDPVDRQNSIERERMEFAMVRERLKKKEQEEKQKALVNHESDTPTTTTTSSVEPGDFEDEEYEDDEYLEEEEEEDYLDSKTKPQNQEEEFNIDDIQTPMTEMVDFRLSKPKKVAPVAKQEEDAYRPPSMIPKRSQTPKTEKPETKEPHETKPVKTSKIPIAKKPKKTTKIFKKLGLKKEKKVPEVLLTPADPNLPPTVIPKPILKNKTLKKKESPKPLLKFGLGKPADKSVSEEESEGEFSGKKKKQVRIATPTEEEELKRLEEKPIDENAKENQVLIYHYSDIVKEFGGNKKPPPRLYLNYDELKAHARPEEPEKVNSRPLPVSSSNQVNSVKASTNGDSVPVETQRLNAMKPKSSPRKIRTSFEYFTDIVLFFVACWLYVFKNELYAVPILALMAYRQLRDIAVDKYRQLKNLIPKKFRGNGNAAPTAETNS